MHFDDRLVTVLRRDPTDSGTGGVRAARTQYRQLLDLLGRRKPVRGRSLAAQAWLRLDALREMIPVAERARIVAEGGSPLGSPELVTNLANDEAEVAAAALQRARLSEEDWEALIPRLPVRARGFLRFRTDLPHGTKRLLDRLGVHDRGLPGPEISAAPLDEKPAPVLAKPPVTQPPPPPPPNASEIGKIVERIEAFQRARTEPEKSADAPRLPLGDKSDSNERPAIAAFDFTCDHAGLIDWADSPAAPMIEGARLANEAGSAPLAFRTKRPLNSTPVTLQGASAIAGEWVVDAAPRFGPGGGFRGYAGRFRRPPPDLAALAEAEASATRESEAEQIRELLHELRTPVNAIQGFAEVIQQQLFGPVPHDYRAHAASIAGDAARILSGFDELDRLAKLESGALDLETGECDFAALIRSLVDQMQGVLAPRTAGFNDDVPESPCLIALDRSEAEAIAWRIMATIAGTVSAGERVELSLSCDADAMRLRIQLTATLLNQNNVFASTARPASGALTAGTFGAGFALRLARAEARAAGGDLVSQDGWLTLALPHPPVALDRQQSQP